MKWRGGVVTVLGSAAWCGKPLGWGIMMKLARREFLQLAGAAAALPVFARGALAQTYPARPVRILVGAAAGSTPDIVARLIAQSLSERLGQQFIVEDRTGANVATEAVVR